MNGDGNSCVKSVKELKREVQTLATFTPPWSGWARQVVCFRKLQKSSNGKAWGEGRGFLELLNHPTSTCEEEYWQLNSLHSSGFRLPTRFWNLAAGVCYHSATRALERSSTDDGPRSCSPSKVLGGAEVRALRRQVKFFHNKLGQPFFYGALWLCHIGTVSTVLEEHYF